MFHRFFRNILVPRITIIIHVLPKQIIQFIDLKLVEGKYWQYSGNVKETKKENTLKAPHLISHVYPNLIPLDSFESFYLKRKRVGN